MLRRYRNQHANKIWLQMTFQHPALFLPGKLMEYIAEILPELAIKNFSPAFRDPPNMVLAFPFCVA